MSLVKKLPIFMGSYNWDAGSRRATGWNPHVTEPVMGMPEADTIGLSRSKPIAATPPGPDLRVPSWLVR